MQATKQSRKEALAIAERVAREGPPRCRCGRQMDRPAIPRERLKGWESGTVRVDFCCPEWSGREDGHQWYVETTSEHQATGCCLRAQVRG